MNKTWTTRADCAARLRGLVPPDETIAAVGTAQELRTLGPDLGSGTGFTFLVVTDTRVMFAFWGSAEAPVVEIRFDEVTGWASGTQYNCFAVLLTHPQIIRRVTAPARRFLWFRWGRVEVDRARTQTIFRFSRPGTKAAKAVRAALEERHVPHETLRFEEKTRAERTYGSHLVLTAPRD